jgi:hypothetical protein
VLVVLTVIFLLLVLLKYLYLTLPDNLFFAAWGAALRRLMDPILRDWAVLAWLWQVIPAWQVIPGWTGVYTVWGAMVVIGIGGFLLKSAHDRQAQIRQVRQEIEREGWKREGLGPIGSPRARQTRGIDQYSAPAEPWHKKPLGIVSLGMVVTVIGGLLLHLAKTLVFTNVR